MENGTGIAEDAKLGERNSENSEELGPIVKENVELHLDGSKDSDENGVFEETDEVKTLAVVSENSTVIRVGNSELIGNEGNSDVFREVVGIPTVAQFSERPRLKTQFFNYEKRIAAETIVTGERNGLMDYITSEYNDSDVEDEKDNRKDVDSASAAGETMNLDGGNEILVKSNQKSEDDISDKKKSFLEALTSGGLKTLDANNKIKVLAMSEALEANGLTRAETDMEKLETEKLPYETKGIQDANEIDCDICCGTPENGSFDHEMIKSTDALKEQIHETSSEIEEGNGVKGIGVGPKSEFNGDALHKNEEDAILSSEHQEDNCEIDLIVLHPELEEDQGGEREEKSFISSANVDEDKTMELKKLGLEFVHGEKVDVDGKNSISASDTSTTGHAKESSGSDANLHSAPDGSKLVREIAKVEPHFSSPEVLVEGSRYSLLNLADSSAKVSVNVTKKQEQGGVEYLKKELPLSGNKEITLGAGVLLSSGNSSTSGLSPVHPVSSRDAAKMPGPVSQDSSANAEPETTPSGDISSSQIKDSRPKSKAHIPSTNISSATPVRPAGLGHAAPLLEPTSRVVQQPRVNGAVSATQNQLIEDPTNWDAEEYDEIREKLQMIRVKFLRLAHRLGQTPHNVVVAQVLYRLGLAEQLHGRSGGRVATFSFDRASAMAERLEAAGKEALDFTCTIMVLGKSGVGKSATINSIFDEAMIFTDAFQSGTKKVQDVVGTVQGIRVRVIDTPGLLPSWSDQRENESILRSVKRFIKKTPPDIVLYLDRLDMQSRDFGDMPLLRTITEIFGASIWFNAIVVLTHAASAPPEGPNGTTTSYDMFVTQRSHVVQQAIRQAAGDMRLMNPVSLVENHSACRTNRAGQRVLPNGQVWKPHLLLLSFASKILAEANTLLKLQDTPPGRPFAPRTRSPPLPFLLSSLLQSRPEVKLPSEQFGDDDDDALDDDLGDCSDLEEESEYDKLPPFKSLTKAQLEKLNKAQRQAYYDELELREKLFMKKQLREERERRKMMKRMEEAAKNLPAEYGDNGEEEANAAASVPVPIPDLALPASFDSDNPTYRYRSLDSSNPWLVRAVLEPNGWDHDIGYDGINVERLFAVKDKVPISFSSHISKDKKDTNLQMELASSLKHGKGKATSLGFDMQSVGKDYAYTLRSETRFSNHRINKATAGLSATLLGDVLTGGLKLEDKLIVGKCGQLVVSGGAIYGRGEVAYGGSLEATLRDKDNPLGGFLSTLGLSIMDWHGDIAIGCNSQTQIPIGRHTNLIGRFNINNRGSGQFSIKINSSEQLQIVLIGLVPIVKKIIGYSQQVQ